MIAILVSSATTILIGMLATKAPRHSRHLYFLPHVASASWALHNSAVLTTNERYNGLYAMSIALYTLHLYSYLYLVDTDLDTDTWVQVWFIQPNLRYLRTSKSTARAEHAAQKQSRKQFVKTRLMSIMIIYALLVVYYEVIDLPSRLHIQPNDFTPSKRSFFRRLAASQSPVTLHEVLVRIWSVFEFIILDWASLTAIHSVFASISVSLHLDLPKHWPPLFGSIRETYSLRNYWTKFWHLLFYRMGNAYADWLLRLLLAGNERTPLSRYLKNFLVFLFSGIVHFSVRRLTCGRGTGEWQIGVWYLAQPVLFLAEDRVLGGRQASRMGKLLGYLWVYGFLFWSVPKIQYPALYGGDGLQW